MHGFGASLQHFRFQIPALVEAGFHVYAMDLLGFGASEKPLKARSVKFSTELYIQQIVDFIKNHNDDDDQPWILCGNSLGSLCQLGAATELASNVNIAGLCLFNSAGTMTGFNYQEIPSWAHPLLGHAQYFLLGDFHGQFLFSLLQQRSTIQTILKQTGLYQDTTNLDDDLLDLLLTPATDEGAGEVFLTVYGGPAGPTREALLQKVPHAIPILLLWGEQDPFTPFDDDVQKFAALHPNLELRSLTNAGHCLHDEHPEWTNEQVLQFVCDVTMTTKDSDAVQMVQEEKA